jgi:hypothetical protein
MHHSQESNHLRVLVDAHHCQPSAAQIEHMLGGLTSLGKQVEHFPVSDLHILIEHNDRGSGYTVKTTLVLPGRSLVVSQHDLALHAAYLHCLTDLEEQVRAYKDQLDQAPERQKQLIGTHSELLPATDPDRAALEAAVEERDYVAFRAVLSPYEEPLRKRVGRWLQRYPDLNAAIGNGLKVADVVEEVFLFAFERHPHRPQDVRFGDWLEALLDPAVQALRHNKERELENINLARSAIDAERGRGVV